jgi:hypothetical protein
MQLLRMIPLLRSVRDWMRHAQGAIMHWAIHMNMHWAIHIPCP